MDTNLEEKLDLKKLEQNELEDMNYIILTKYPDISRNTLFENNIICGEYCLAVLLRDYKRKRTKPIKLSNV